MKKKFSMLMIGIFLVVLTAFQTDQDHPFLEMLKSRLAAFNTSYPEEKLYVQFDKPFYKPGEDIWINVVVLNSITHKPTTISDVVYVDLIDPKGNISAGLELVVRDGTAHGDFRLGDSAPGGLYKVQAYTRWMKNFEKENYFKKEILVQRIITPRLLLKLDYEKESYGPGDPVTASLKIANLKNEKISDAEVNFSVRLSGTEISRSSILSGADGVARINFQLPDSLTTTDGLLQVVVKNRGTEESISRSIPIVLNKIALRFFPEGGHAIENVEGRIAFKALNEFGKGADISGVVLDQDNNVITRLQSFHMGMGAFKLKQLSGKKYFVRIESPSGNNSLMPIPDPVGSGFAMALKGHDEASIEWLIHSPIQGEVYLVGNAHGEIVFSKKIEVQKGENVVSVTNEKFPAGITVFTLFNSQGVEQCERLVFLNGEKGLTIKVKTDKQQYLPGEAVRLEVKTLDHNGKPVAAKMALSVVDDQLVSFADDKQDNILSRMLLSSELKGEIQEPSFYFDPEEIKAKEALDYLLMTQGWRRFTWKEVADSKKVITYAPEKIKNIAGILLNDQRQGHSSEVTLLELGGKKRIVKIKTTKEGHFLFKNIDPTIPLLILARKPGEIVLLKNAPPSISLNDKDGTFILPTEADQVAAIIGNPPKQAESAQPLTDLSGFDFSMENDVTQLSEVVVTALGTEQRKKLVYGSIVTVNDNTLDGMFSSVSIENNLQGRAAGIMVQPQTGNPAPQTNVLIRGVSSLSGGRAEPLYVIDGHPMATSLSQNFSNGSMIGPDDILSIEVLGSPEASAIYGSRASNGALLITTRSRLGYSQFRSTRKPAKFLSATVYPRKFSVTREFYAAPASKKDDMREDFRTTVYWNHAVVTNEKGQASLLFHNNDAISSFRITAEGFSGTGLIGRSEEVFFTELPLSLDAKLPEYLGFEDVLKLPLSIKNETSSAKSAVISLNIPEHFLVEEPFVRKVIVQPKSVETIWFTIRSKGNEGEFPIKLKLECGNYSDEMNHKIRVKPVGFPVRFSFSAKELEKAVKFSIHDAEKNSVKANLTAFPDLLSDLFTGAESILREPHGCFEQVSSSTFPNILALQFLKQSGLGKPAVEKKALGYIDDGYKKLAAYEISGGGFEWFGHPPAHEGLTAYGLLQFSEMKKVFDGVQEKMMNRTRDWLLSRRNGKGGFKQSNGKYGFSAASEQVTNAYITYALSETGTKEVAPEYYKALAEALESKDMYRMALVACTAFNLEKKDDYNMLIDLFKQKVKNSGYVNLKAEHSIVRSYGNSLQIETLALWAIALMKSPSEDLMLIGECIQQILKYRAYGQFGSTQGTTLALKALTEYATLVGTSREDGEIAVYVNNEVADRLSYKSDSREKLGLENFSKNLSNGEHDLRIRFNDTNSPLPYSVDVQWYTKKPQSNAECKVSLSTSLSTASVNVNEIVRLTAVMTNKTAEGLPMTVAVIGIPAGLSAQPWQLKELQEKGVFDFYEIANGVVTLYYREMAPNGQHRVNLDLKAEIPGSFLGTASAAYLYYTNEFKHWEEGMSVLIN